MKYRLAVILLTILLNSCVKAQDKDGLTVMFWNTENLFDTVDDPAKDDDEFTPDGERHWTEKRYRTKLDNTARLIAAAGEDYAPDIIGLCEVENETVMDDLTRRSPLKEIGYRYVMTDSPDSRGIDVALIYRRSSFQLLSSREAYVNLKPQGGGKTRNVLHVSGRIASMDTLDILVCHWPSRNIGVKKSEPLRQAAARVVQAVVDSIYAVRAKPYVIIMGDLNEGPGDAAVRTTLNTAKLDGADKLPDGRLVAVMSGVRLGSYRYQGEWDKYDQFIVTASLLNGHGPRLVNPHVCNFDFIQEPDEKYGGKKPKRTYNGMTYQPGYSDHLPVALDLEF